MSYRNTLVLIAEDCPVDCAAVPVSAREDKTKHLIEYELLTEKPYFYNHEDLIYEVHARHRGRVLEPSFDAGRFREELFRKPHPCMRASMLPKKFGWGVHYDAEGRMALYAMESPEYAALAEDPGVSLVRAMRSARDKSAKTGQ